MRRTEDLLKSIETIRSEYLTSIEIDELIKIRNVCNKLIASQFIKHKRG